MATVVYTNPNSTWYNRIGNSVLNTTFANLQALHSKWKQTGLNEDYLNFSNAVNKLNEHLKIYAGLHSRYNGKEFQDNNVTDWQNTINTDYTYINNALGDNPTFYNVQSPNPNSGDNLNQGWYPDGRFAALTNDRTALGFGPTENDTDYRYWKDKFAKLGLNYNHKDGYGDAFFLTPLTSNEDSNGNGGANGDGSSNGSRGTLQISFGNNAKEGFNWNGLTNYIPTFLELIRFKGDINNTNRVARIVKNGISPGLQGSYNLYSLVTGDEAGRLGYYRRASQLTNKVAQPFTSDASLQMAGLFDAYRQGDEYRALGDLLDNQRIQETRKASLDRQESNKDRETKVANENILRLGLYRKSLADLEAGRVSANWTSTSNLLKGLETRVRENLAKREAITNQIFSIDRQERLLNDTLYQNAKKAWEDNPTDENYRKFKKLQNIKFRQIFEELRLSTPLFVKSGGKFKDDLLYKSTRDAVEHFRKIYKMTTDSTHKNKQKAVKLKRNTTRKLLLGGVAPFTIFTPAVLGGERTVSSGRESSKKSNDTDETLDLVKNLFRQVDGLPIDVNSVYSDMKHFIAMQGEFGNTMDSTDISMMYLNTLYKLNKAKTGKENYNQAKLIVTANNALNEVAVTPQGYYVVLNKEGEITLASLEDIKKGGLNPLTNNDLLRLRETSSNMQFEKGDRFMNIVSNGIGLDKISQYIKNTLPSIGVTELVQLGYTKHKANEIVKGLEELRDAPSGYYEYKNVTKESREQMRAALDYVKYMLPKNMRAILDFHALMDGTSTDNILNKFISTTSTSIHKEYSPLTGKAAKNSGNSGSDNTKDNWIRQWQAEMGGVPHQLFGMITRDSNTLLSVQGTRYPSIPGVNDDMSVRKMLSESGLAGALNSQEGITFGDQHISPDKLKDVMFSNTDVMIVTLPMKIVNGHKEVNLAIKDLFEEAVDAANASGLEGDLYEKRLAEEFTERGLNSLVKSDGTPNKSMFGQFIVAEAYTTDKVGLDNPNSQYIEVVRNPGKDLEERMAKALSTDGGKTPYDIDVKDFALEMFYDTVYRANLFIPFNNNPNASYNALGKDIKIDEAYEFEELYQNARKAERLKPSNSDVLKQ